MTDSLKAANGLQSGKWARLTCRCYCPWSRFRFNTVLSIHGQICDTDQLAILYSFCFFLQGCELHHYSFTDFFFYRSYILTECVFSRCIHNSFFTASDGMIKTQHHPLFPSHFAFVFLFPLCNYKLDLINWHNNRLSNLRKSGKLIKINLSIFRFHELKYT